MGYSKLTYEEFIDNPDVWGIDLPLWANELNNKGYKGVCAIDFYNDIFGDDLEESRLPEDYVTGEYGGIAIERVPILENGKPKLDNKGYQFYKGKRYTITKGNMKLYNLIDKSENFCMISPISYAGKSRKIANARYLYAMCIEIDYIHPKNGISELVYSWKRDFKPIPKPTYIVCSGTGLHIYYVFERPIPLWKNVYISLNEAKKWLTPWLWNRFTSVDENIQYESLNQPFRCVGTITKKGSYVMAFKVGEKITIEYMNKFLPEDKKIENFYKSKYTLEQAKNLYPKWYQKVVVEGKSKNHYNRHQGIYYNWIDKIYYGAVVGKRYNCLENLCSLAVQCQIEPEQVESDCRKVAERMEELTVEDDNHFTEYDVLCALKTYYTASESAFKRRIDFISKKTGITLLANKRNFRTQEEHLKRARAVQNIDYPNGEWREGNGRPKGSKNKNNKKEKLILDFLEKHKNENLSVTEIARKLKVSRTTVYKYMKK